MTKEEMRVYQRERNKRLHDAGLCVSCGKPLEEGNARARCNECSEKMNKRCRERTRALKTAGRCPACAVKLPKGYEYTWCPKCLEAHARNRRVARAERAEQGLCVQCGGKREDEQFLMCNACRTKLREAQRRYIYGGDDV